MIAVSLWQPHAHLIAIGVKPYETRAWTPRWEGRPYRGPIAIHAAKSMDEIEYLAARAAAHKRAGTTPDGFLFAFLATMTVWQDAHKIERFTWGDLPTGAIVATGELTAVYHAAELYPKLAWPERDFGDFSPNMYAWRIDNVKRLPEPIPARGQKGLWEWNP